MTTCVLGPCLADFDTFPVKSVNLGSAWPVKYYASEPLPIGPTGLRDTLAEEGVDLKQLTSSEAQLISNYNPLVGSRPHTWCTATPCTFRSVHR